MADKLDDIVEVFECGMHAANACLDHGYRLLDIQFGSRLLPMPEESKGMQQSHWLRRNPIYIVGRTEDVASYRPPPRRQQQ